MKISSHLSKTKKKKERGGETRKINLVLFSEKKNRIHAFYAFQIKITRTDFVEYLAIIIIHISYSETSHLTRDNYNCIFDIYDDSHDIHYVEV